MRADRAEGDSGGYRVGELCDGPHGGKGHEPCAEGSRAPHQRENPQEGRGQGSCSLRARGKREQKGKRGSTTAEAKARHPNPTEVTWGSGACGAKMGRDGGRC